MRSQVRSYSLSAPICNQTYGPIPPTYEREDLATEPRTNATRRTVNVTPPENLRQHATRTSETHRLAMQLMLRAGVLKAWQILLAWP